MTEAFDDDAMDFLEGIVASERGVSDETGDLLTTLASLYPGAVLSTPLRPGHETHGDWRILGGMGDGRWEARGRTAKDALIQAVLSLQARESK